MTEHQGPSEAPARRGGRPTKAEAAERDRRLLEAATRLFMEKSYDGVSMEAVAEAAGVGKPTLYHRYKDKRELFAAVLTERIEQWLSPLAEAAEDARRAGAQDGLEVVLDRVSRALLVHVLKPGAPALTRAIAAQKAQFPELAQLAYQQGWLRAVAAVARILRAMGVDEKAQDLNAEDAAEIFLNLIMGPSSRAAIYGLVLDPELLERKRVAAVRFFLRGLLGG